MIPLTTGIGSTEDAEAVPLSCDGKNWRHRGESAKGNVGLSSTSNSLYEGVEHGLRNVAGRFDGALSK